MIHEENPKYPGAPSLPGTWVINLASSSVSVPPGSAPGAPLYTSETGTSLWGARDWGWEEQRVGGWEIQVQEGGGGEGSAEVDVAQREAPGQEGVMRR